MFLYNTPNPGELIYINSPQAAKGSIVYTDYNNVAVFFSCKLISDKLFPMADRRFFISVRNRTFDSLSQFGQAASALTQLGADLNDLRFFYQGPNCKN